MIQLRDYQHEMIEGCRVAYRAGKRRVCLQGSTGCGKGTVLSFMAKSAAERGLRVGVVAHRGEILDQISRTLSSVEVPHGMIRAGHRIDRSKKVHVASVQTLVNRFDQVDPFDFIIGDEAHHCVSKTWVKVFAQYPNARWLGCAAGGRRVDYGACGALCGGDQRKAGRGAGLGQETDRMPPRALRWSRALMSAPHCTQNLTRPI